VIHQNFHFAIASLVAPPPGPPLPFEPRLLGGWRLRDYQEDMLVEAADLMAMGYRRILLQLPTGGGKTVMAAAMLGACALLEQRSQFIVHRKELIEQTSCTFNSAGINHGFIAAGRPFDPEAAVILAGVQTLVNRLEGLLPPNLAVIDEAHHCTAASWDRVMSAYPDAFIIGLSATPERLDGRGLDDHFDVMVTGPSVAELIEQGYLSPFDYYAPDVPDLGGVATVAGDFNRGQIGALMDKPKLIGDVVEHYLRLALGQQGIVFAANREHSRNLASAFAGNGVSAAHVDGSMPDKERKRIVDAFREGAIDIMSNCELFGEGFDVPGIVYCGLARPTKSLSLHRQQCGRSLRVFEGKRAAIICDHAGNALRLGDLPDTEREWSLQGRAVRARAAGASDAMSVRQCLTCYRVSPSTVATCPGCGTEFPAMVRKLVTEEGRLTKLEREELRKAAVRDRRAEEGECRTYAQYKSLAEARGYDNPRVWAKNRMKMRSGSWRF